MSHKWDAKVKRDEEHVVHCEKCNVTVERVLVDGKMKNFHTPDGGERSKGVAPKCEIVAGNEVVEVTEPETAEVPTALAVPFPAQPAEVEIVNETGYGAPCKDCGDVLTGENCTVNDSDQCDKCDQAESVAALS
jgi:hypothetical protein